MFAFNYKFYMRLVYILFWFFICLCIASCSGNGYKIKDAEKVEIFFKTEDSVLHYIDTSRELINTFRKVLDGKIEERKCPTMGEIRFLSKDTVLFEAGFSISGDKEGCQQLMAGEKAWKLTYKAGMYLSETFADLRKKQ
jgi:hypothetical protein